MRSDDEMILDEVFSTTCLKCRAEFFFSGLQPLKRVGSMPGPENRVGAGSCSSSNTYTQNM